MIWLVLSGEFHTAANASTERAAAFHVMQSRISLTNTGGVALRLFLAVIIGVISIQSVAVAGDAALGKKKMIKCVTCHGADGVSKNPDAPNISGQVERYLIKSMKAFKSGERKNDMMAVVVKGLEDADIENLAAYYSSIKVTVEKPQ